jgi:hypothetical protein
LAHRGHRGHRGDALFFGSAGDRNIGAPIVDASITPDRGGHLLAAADGDIFGLGDATFSGSHGCAKFDKPIVGIA